MQEHIEHIALNVEPAMLQLELVPLQELVRKEAHMMVCVTMCLLCSPNVFILTGSLRTAARTALCAGSEA
jgi:hypothetical protein